MRQCDIIRKINNFYCNQIAKGGNALRGHFITFEGPEGSGKTTQVDRINDLLSQKGVKVLKTREPGGIKISEQIRKIIVDKNNTEMDAWTELLLYLGARRQHLVEKVIPALDEGNIIVCDRFLDSSLAYQGYARGLGINKVWELQKPILENCIPDLTILIDVPAKVGLERVHSNNRNTNRLDLESLDFHRKVVEGYEILTRMFPDRIVKVNGNQPVDDVTQEVVTVLEKRLPILTKGTRKACV